MVKKNKIPILEFDDNPIGIIHAPNLLRPIEMPKHAVMVFFHDVIAKMLSEGRLVKIADLHSEVGNLPIYETTYKEKRIALFHPMIGGPFAAGMLEEVIALGGRIFIACGGCGVLDKKIAVGHLIVPTSALRCEGTSYHYLPPSRTIELDDIVTAAITTTLDRHNVLYLKGRTWTTDAFYRETKAMIHHRKKEGCIAVEMECASFAAVAKMRNVQFGQILYAGDDISSDEWDSRSWKSKTTTREKLVELAMECCLAIQ